jgi:exodeoxyribonuclease V alpha subunit
VTVPTLESLRRAHALRPIDVHLARALCRMAGEEDEEVALAVALTSRHVGKGHVCLDFDRLVAEPPLELAPPGADPADRAALEAATWPDAAGWRGRVATSPLTRGAGAPLVLDGAGRLYLARYHTHQGSLGEGLLERAALLRSDVDADVLSAGLARLFPSPETDLQRVAALTAVLRSFAVVSGGPGTGKTTTVVRILALLAEQALAAGQRPPQIELLAPTGKAAARMGEAIQKAVPSLDVSDEVKAAIPVEARTIHRGLGYVGRATEFRHGPGNPLAADVVIVDEASMIAFALLARLVSAVPDSARLILLGDKDQLASVEAGAVLGDICNAGDPWAYTSGWSRTVSQVSGDAIEFSQPDQREGATVPSGPLGDCLVQLTHSWRFGDDSGIGQVARAVNAGLPDDVMLRLVGDDHPDVRWVGYAPNLPSLPPALLAEAMAGFRPWIDADSPKEKLDAFGRFRVLCAHRRGRFGVDAVNTRVEIAIRALRPDGAGEPVLVVENDYVLDLYNGDVGIVMDTGDGARAYFQAGDGTLRALAPARLPSHTPCHAMTVHKSQGSEFNSVAVLLPPEASPILTRELLYTAVTRARETVTVYAPEDVLRATVERRIERASGLRDVLWTAANGGGD